MARPPFQNEHNYAAVQEVQRHDDAVHYFGEMTAFILWWDIPDLTDGLVNRCSTCFLAYGDVAAAYGQSSKQKCPECFGTTYSGGFRALIYRPALWATEPINDDVSRIAGIITSISATVQTTSDFWMRKGDVMVRADGTHWSTSQPKGLEITTGFGFTGDGGSYVRSSATAVLQDESQASYDVPVNLTALRTSIGWSPSMLYPNTSFDVIPLHGYLNAPTNIIGGTAFVSPNGVIDGGSISTIGNADQSGEIDGGTP